MREKKIWIVTILCIFVLVGCEREKLTTIETLNIGLVPSADATKIEAGFKGLDKVLISELNKLGYKVDSINFEVGESYDQVGENLAKGEYDIAFLPAGTLVEYEDEGSQAILTATRADLSIDSESPLDWNVEPTTYTDGTVSFYRSLIIAGPSEKGKDLSSRVENGELMAIEDLQNAKWCVQTSKSSAGFLYPSLWLTQNYNHDLYDLPNHTAVDGYGEAIKALEEEKCDVAPIYADARQEYSNEWQGQTGDIWNDTNVIGVTDPIINDAVAISKKSKYNNEEFIEAVQKAFINAAETQEGQEAFSVYGYNGCKVADSSDYEAERAISQELERRELEELE